MLFAVLALGAVAGSLWQLARTMDGVVTGAVDVGGTPARVFRPAGAGRTAVVVVAHGFAGSQQLMRPFAVTLARNGLTAVTFDFLGHGRNPAPLTGSITEVDGATRALVRQTAAMVAYAKALGDGRVAILGHSMASDIIVRVAEADPAIAATVGVSPFSPAVTRTAPRLLLTIVGEWEPGLREEALRVTGLVSAPAAAAPGVTYGDVAAGTARRMAVSPHVEHVSVLYSPASMHEAAAWLDAVFGLPPPDYADARGPWVLLLLAGVVLLVRPVAACLPVVVTGQAGAGLGWRRLWAPLALATVVTPLVLRIVPTHFLPVLVGDYLAVHFLLFGLLLGAGAWVGRDRARVHQKADRGRLAVAAAVLTLVTTGGLGWALDRQVTSFMPGSGRGVLILALLGGTLPFFLALEWTTHGVGAARGGPAVARLAFLASLALAVALDFQALFFLAIIVPVILLFFLVTGLFGRWATRRTGHPAVAALAHAVLFAWAIGVTFPLLAR